MNGRWTIAVKTFVGSRGWLVGLIVGGLLACVLGGGSYLAAHHGSTTPKVANAAVAATPSPSTSVSPAPIETASPVVTSPAPSPIPAPCSSVSTSQTYSRTGAYCLVYPSTWYHVGTLPPDEQYGVIAEDDFSNENVSGNPHAMDSAGIWLTLTADRRTGTTCTGLYVSTAKQIIRSDQVTFAGSPATRYVLAASGSAPLYMAVLNVQMGAVCYNLAFLSYSEDPIVNSLNTIDQIVTSVAPA